MSERYTDQISWEKSFEDIYETDLDGHGTREGLVLGYISTPKGTYTYEAIGSQCYPYEDEIEIQDDSIEETGFESAEPPEAEE